MSWRKLLLQEGPNFIKWLDESNARLNALSKLAGYLELFLINTLRSPEDCISFWNAIPLVRTACNFNETYELPFASAAYAYVHLLDRYWRTWEVLIELTNKGALPLGPEGVRVLDVGTGPAPTPYAIQDYYALLRKYGDANGIAKFSIQNTNFTIVESSPSMRHFIHLFSETCSRPGPFGADIIDFGDVNPPAKRKALYKYLRDTEYYDGDDYYLEYLPEEANMIAQRYQRFRMVVFSNFFTVEHTVRKFRDTLDVLLGDLRSGTVMLVLGATGNQYKNIYTQITKISKNKGFVELIEVDEMLGKSAQSSLAQRIIKQCQHSVFKHLVELAGRETIQESISLQEYAYRDFAEKQEIELPLDIRWPDYWTPTPYARKKLTFSLKAYRKGKWTRRTA